LAFVGFNFYTEYIELVRHTLISASIFLLVLVIVSPLFAQDPSISKSFFTPASDVGCKTEVEANFIFCLNGTVDAPVSRGEVILTISFNNLEPREDPFMFGPFADHFEWIYVARLSTLRGKQIKDIPAGLCDTIGIKLKPSLDFFDIDLEHRVTINVQRPAYMAETNSDLNDGSTGFVEGMCNSDEVFDDDNDGVVNIDDRCEGFDDNADIDGDNIPDGCDDDNDNDGVINLDDQCPGFVDSLDMDSDGIPDGCDEDNDNDGIANDMDICPGSDDLADLDGDLIPDGCDNDNDNDGVLDSLDQCPEADDNVDLNRNGIPDGCDTKAFIPNAFTPNGDGINDLFLIFPNMQVTDFSMMIFDRYGALIYESESNTSGWDGRTRNGGTVTEGVFAYVIEFDGEVRTGTNAVLK